MHITAGELYKGECTPYIVGNFETLLGGKPITRIVKANDKEGWLVRIGDGSLYSETLYGNVEFRLI